jgi:hypothetical protein
LYKHFIEGFVFTTLRFQIDDLILVGFFDGLDFIMQLFVMFLCGFEGGLDSSNFFAKLFDINRVKFGRIKPIGTQIPLRSSRFHKI